MSDRNKCRKCGGSLETILFRPVDDPVLKGMGGFAAIVGKCAGAIVKLRCQNCGLSFERTESYMR